MKSMSRN